jgi:hypothetical protein
LLHPHPTLANAELKIRQGFDSKKPHCICVICFDNPTFSLEKCLFKPSYNGLLLDETGNLTSHLKSKHADIFEAAKNSKNFKYEKAPASLQQDETPDQTMETPGGTTISTNPSDPPMNIFYQSLQDTGRKDLLAQFH